ncbi:MAG: WecB/TagA/CpsF family glycosyltransferase [Mesorhizobium sp.]|uniref:WecB/TagA/CpsF family glycosyltransferase n=1 Tax=Mesorhizobium sp. TaxID=1871066 RepID=UPI001224C638|nr:WecB/TagA/CpsF family glycosyltransferase [Mesorhizobium sp.]TIP29580.1 MAG: WecB/TagA/CpsF family glycosyltransferase [Mesorhizobium sp.]
MTELAIDQGHATDQGQLREQVLGVPVHALGLVQAVNCVFDWALRRESRTVFLCNVHSVVTARRNRAHAEAMDSADLVAPDGAPVAWMLRRQGHADQPRISGPDLMWICCRRASELGTAMFLYGGSPGTLQRLEGCIRTEFVGINIVGSYSPPRRPLSAEEDEAVVRIINQSGARIVWVGLGCPKQESWMQGHRGRINAVMLGVGAAFDFHAGDVKRAPQWMQKSGLEWLHRLFQDPRRLASRYLVTNSLFILALLQALLLPRRRLRDG